MLKHAAIKKYGKKLLPQLQKRYGQQEFYTASQIRATVYQCSFNPKYLPLGYLLFMEHEQLKDIIAAEFPQLCMEQYKTEMQSYLTERKFHGELQALA
ncbi:DUF6559 family protein [Litorilituus lipolyticus]|uniref:Uncharacterized protein n=1 Tax=Litorilituus lipolyticus TaxID=2491017 RepID=A0A502L7A6_9GAMM|nr:DUF6559 family protein [Litorilituus lipolyticus]TPH18994.1 hypothetical protein EPA86_01480 [Litorilituus lipolyticus]